MNYPLICLFVCLLGCVLPLRGQYRVRTVFSDVPTEAETVIARYGLKNHYKSLPRLEKDINRLLVALDRRHFSLSALDTLITENKECTAEIYVGQRQPITRVEITEEDSLAPVCRKHIRRFSAKEIHSLTDVIRFHQSLSRTLWNNGYPFAVSRIDSLYGNENGLTAVISVTEHHYITLDSIIVLGDLKLSRSFLFGYLGLRRKGAYNEERIRKTELHLRSLPFVTLTQSPGVAFSEDKSALYVYANKKKTNQFDGYIGVVPAEANTSKVLLTGSLLLHLTNICTIGERLKLHWQRIGRGSQTLDISVDFPYLFYTPFGLDGAFWLEKRDTAYLTLRAEAALRYYWKQNSYLRGFYRYHNCRLVYNEAMQYITRLPENVDFNAHFYGVEIFFEQLDHPFNPRRGQQWNLSAAAGKRTVIRNINLPDSLYRQIPLASSRIRIEAGFTGYFPLHKRWVWKLSAKGGYLFASNLFDNERFTIGGLHTVRGFEEKSLPADAYATLSNELRFIAAKNMYLQAFFDGAWFQQRSDREGYLSGFPFGFGAGVSFETRAGIFAFNYALGKHPQNKFRFASGVITFGYAAVF